jgi:hypothetical protein
MNEPMMLWSRSSLPSFMRKQEPFLKPFVGLRRLPSVSVAHNGNKKLKKVSFA